MLAVSFDSYDKHILNGCIKNVNHLPEPRIVKPAPICLYAVVGAVTLVCIEP